MLSRLLLLEPGFSVAQAMARSPLLRPEDVARYAEGLRRAGLREDAGPLLDPRAPLAILHSVIDLVPQAPHSPIFCAE